MKRIAIIAAMMLLTISSYADVVSKSEAEKAAQTILGTPTVSYAGNSLGDALYGDAKPTYYVFNGNGQWAIIAADDCAVPVLMQGEGTFDADNIPDAMKSLLASIDFNIGNARVKTGTRSSAIKQSWDALSARTRAAASPVEKYVIDKDGKSGTAKWSQSNPFNKLCPLIDGTRCPTGCVATAMSIVLRFYQWPATGTGTISAYTTRTNAISLPATDNNYEYNWASLPVTKYSSTSWTTDQANKVSEILMRLGRMVEMDYKKGGSGAYSDDIPKALATYMSYSPASCEKNRSGYSNEQWFNMLKAELDANHPIIYSGSDVNGGGGHCFVCDGYNSNNQVHINWGWGGSYNAWYSACYLGPVGGEADAAVYSKGDAAIFGLVPAKSGDYTNGTLAIADLSKNATDGLTITSGTIAKNSTFTVKVTNIENIGQNAYSGTANIALVSKSGAIKEIIGKNFSISSLDSGYYYSDHSFSCTITTDIALGDKLCLCYIRNNVWTLANTDYTRSLSGTQVIGAIGALDMTLIQIPEHPVAGQTVYPGLLLGHKVPSSVTWYLDNSTISNGYVTMPSGTHTFKVVISYTDGSHETITKKVTDADSTSPASSFHNPSEVILD